MKSGAGAQVKVIPFEKEESMSELKVDQRYQVLSHKHATEREQKFCTLIGNTIKITEVNGRDVYGYNETKKNFFTFSVTDLGDVKRLNPKVEVGDLVRITKHEHKSGSCPHIGKERIVETVDALGQAERFQSLDHPFSEWGQPNVEYEVVKRKSDEVKLPESHDWVNLIKIEGEVDRIFISVSSEAGRIEINNSSPTKQDVFDVIAYLANVTVEAKREYMTKWMNVVWPKMDNVDKYGLVPVIKAMREDLKLGLKEVKEFVESWPEFASVREERDKLRDLATKLNATIVWN